jgi:hypothetical protein
MNPPSPQALPISPSAVIVSPDAKNDVLRFDLKRLLQSDSRASDQNVTLLETMESQSASAKHVAVSSKRLVGTPYCDFCKTYLSHLMTIHKNQKKSNQHQLGLNAALGPQQQNYDSSSSQVMMSGFLSKHKFGRALHEAFGFRQTRWFVLGDGHLVYYMSPDDFGVTFPKGVVHLEGCRIADEDPSGTDFIVERSVKLKFSLRAATVGEKRVWMAAMRQYARPSKWSASAQNLVGPEAGHFCALCNSYLNMDDFTLAEVDGELEKFERKKNVWGKRWVVLARKSGHYTTEQESQVCHIAYYNSMEDVPRYNPNNILHFTPDNISADSSHPNQFSIKTEDREYQFRAPNAESLSEWLSALQFK